MKKVIINVLCVLLLFTVSIVPASYAENETSSSYNVIQNEQKSGTGQLVEIKDKAEKKLEDYKEQYGNNAYGLAAYILNIARIYSIPFCFIGIAISAISQYVLGIRRLDERDKGFNAIIAFVTIFLIAQVLPLIFAIVVKGWRG